MIAGKVSVPLPQGAKQLDVATADEMFEATRRELTTTHHDIFIGCAAVGDWKPEKAALEKISTHTEKSITLTFVPTPKIIDQVKTWSPQTFLVAFRAVHGLSPEALVKDATARRKQARADLIVANDAARADTAFEADTNEVVLVSAQGEIFKLPMESKLNIAFSILAIVGAQAYGEKG